jgi:hypothetical protein
MFERKIFVLGISTIDRAGSAGLFVVWTLCWGQIAAWVAVGTVICWALHVQISDK